MLDFRVVRGEGEAITVAAPFATFGGFPHMRLAFVLAQTALKMPGAAAMRRFTLRHCF